MASSLMQTMLTEEAVQLKPGQQWLEDSMPVVLQLVEDGTAGGKIVVRGEFAKAGAATENKRVYPMELWEREIKRLTPAMQERKLMGELDHPNDGRTQLARVSHIVTAMNIADDGRIMGEAEALDTARGRDLQAMLKAGCKVGVSSRGYGSTRTNDQGEEVVQEDYNLVTFDFVAEPADSTAYPDVFSEDKETGMNTQAQRDEDQAKAKKFAAAVEAEAQGRAGSAASDDLKKQFEDDILSKLGRLSTEAREKIRTELMNDPKVAGALAAVEQIKTALGPFITSEDSDATAQLEGLNKTIKEQELKIADLEKQVEDLAGMAREAGYKYYLERALTGHPERGLVMKLIGDLSQYEEAGALKAKLEGVLDELNAKMEAEAARIAAEQERVEQANKAVKAERARAEESIQSLKADTDKLTEALEKALEANKQMGLQLYARERLADHPEGRKIMRLVEAANIDSQEAVESIIEEHRIEESSEDEVSQVRARVRRMTGGGFGSTPKDEEKPREKPQRTLTEETDYNGLGVGIGALKQLSGLTPRH